MESASSAASEARKKEFIAEALRIIDEAQRRGIILRLMGGFAIRLHCPKYDYLYSGLNRIPAFDFDLVSYSEFRPKMKELFGELGYEPLRTLALMGRSGRSRQIYEDDAHGRSVDVFFDKLEMCHIIDFTGRLELDYPTITLSDLFLQKMQIVRINEKDIKDTIIMLREHEVGEKEKDTVNVTYITRILSGDWGFYYTVLKNLETVSSMLRKYDALNSEDREDIQSKMGVLREKIEGEPKTMRWKVRARIGPAKKWYADVEEVRR